MISYLIRSSIFGIVALLAFTFIPAGTFHYWQGWAYVVTWIIVGSTYTVYVATHDPALLKRRTEAGISYEKEPTQKVIIFFLFVAFIAFITQPPLDHRFGVEEGQTVISTGMYGIIRHPMYFGALFLLVGTPLALGSWWSLLLVPLFLPILYFRMANEEKVLKRDLQGYEEYTRKVRRRLIPGIY